MFDTRTWFHNSQDIRVKSSTILNGTNSLTQLIALVLNHILVPILLYITPLVNTDTKIN